MSASSTSKLKTAGKIDAKKGETTLVHVKDLFLPKSGPLAHPRAGDELDPIMLADVKASGVRESIACRRDGMHGGKERLTIIDGCRRYEHLLAAAADGPMKAALCYIEVELVKGDDKAMLRLRLARNSQPMKKPDGVRALALTAIALDAQRATVEEILEFMPRWATKVLLVEGLLRWNDLTAAAKAGFEGGAAAGLMPKVLAAPREEQAKVLQELVAAGCVDTRGATRRQNAAARVKASATIEAGEGDAEGEASASTAKVGNVRRRDYFEALLRVMGKTGGCPVELTAMVRFLAGENAALEGFPGLAAMAAQAGFNSQTGRVSRHLDNPPPAKAE